MELSADMGEKHYWGLDVDTYFGDKENTYQAYCPYLDETIEFPAGNASYRPFESQYANTGVGGNCRGFSDTDVWNMKGKMPSNAANIFMEREALSMGWETPAFLSCGTKKE